MLGFRGCRLGIVYPEISEMQARAIFEAACEVQKAGIKVEPEVMIPLVGFKKESNPGEVVHAAKKVMAENKTNAYLVGTMIELPRGALMADQIAETAQFFSFGTNDLTQTGLGMSRDDSGTFLPCYAELDITRPIHSPRSTRRRRRPDADRRRKGRKTRPISRSASAANTAANPTA